MLRLITLLLFTSSLGGCLFAQTIEWARTGGGSLSDKATDIVVDAEGNIYITGFYNEAATFGSIDIPFSNPSSKEAFVAKMDPQGNYLWVQWGVNYYDDRGLGMCLDPAGNVYITGTCWGGIVFGGVSAYNSTGYTDQIFVVKIDTNGNVVWVKNAGNDGNFNYPYDDDHGFDVASDSQGNIFVTGFVSNNDFMVQNALFDAISIPLNPGDSLGFIGKLSNAGVWQWVETFGAVDAQRDHRIAVDNDDNIYVVGGFRQTADFGTQQLTSAGETDVFVAKYNTTGQVLFATAAGGPLSDRANDITFDNSNSMIVTGEFRDSILFGGFELNNYGSGPSSRDIFVAKISKTGEWKWATKAGSKKGTERGNSVAANSQGNIFVTGQIRETAKFGSSIILEADPDSVQVFVAGIDTNGVWRWAKVGGGSSYDRGAGVACDENCNVYATGYYEGQATFESESISSLSGSKDIFVLKYSDACFGYNYSDPGPDVEPPTYCELTHPNVFTPNGDEANDLLLFSEGCSSEYKAVIVNRWGEVVFETNDSYLGWDGNNKNGVPVVAGVYFYKINTVNTKDEPIEVHGFITLVR